MEKITARDEGLRIVNDIPLPIECLIMPSVGIKNKWGTPHYHDYIELLYVLEGEYEVQLNGTVTHLSCHSMFVVQPGEPHTTRKLAGKQTLLCIKFLPQILYSSEQSVTELEYTIPYVFESLSSCRKFDSELLSETFIPGAFQEICEEYKEKGFGYELALRSQVLRIFLWILRNWHRQAGSPAITAPNQHTAALLCRAREYVKENYASATLADAARQCGLSYGYFSRIFNTYMKMSFSDYVNLVRVNHSMQLLASTDISITDIAMESGFSTTSYYIQVFKKHKSISPNRFRKMFKKNFEIL